METLHALFGTYYGLDWLTLMIGLTSSYMVSGGRLKAGFTIGILSCAGGMTLAYMSAQQGFIVYNGLLIGMNIRGILRGDRRASTRAVPVNENTFTQPSAVPVHARAR
ncbi:MAG: hypothetical protein KGQ41_00795 [Alphaproteobacteria bacterium]|nr:hypothetical protein [Alphaproteobacteria bacterium]